MEGFASSFSPAIVYSLMTALLLHTVPLGESGDVAYEFAEAKRGPPICMGEKIMMSIVSAMDFLIFKSSLVMTHFK